MVHLRILLAFLSLTSTSMANDVWPEANDVCLDLLSKRTGAVALKSIVDLPSNAVIDPKIIEKVPSRIVGQSIVRRIRNSIPKTLLPWAPNEVPLDWRNETNLHFVFDPELLPHIRKNGFLNQHQTLSSRGSLTPKYRSQLEDALADLRVSEIYPGTLRAHKVRPKYAMVDLIADRYLGTRTSLGEWYGDWIAVLHQHVKTRATWTENDSLFYGIKYFENVDNRRRIQGTFADDRIDISVKGGYVEAQIWGELDLNDVEYLLVPPGASREQLDSLRDLSLTIYEYITVEQHGRMRRIPGRRIL